MRLSAVALLAVLALGLLPLGTARAEEAPRLEAAWKRFAETYRAAVARQGVIGSSLLLVHDGEVVARVTSGLADRETARPVDDDTIFHWASITKTLTGIAVLQLRDRGKLSLDDPVVKYLPELRQVHDPFGDPSEITIRHVLSHSAGFRDPTWPWGGDKDWHPFEPTRWDQVVAMFPYTEVLFPPGSRYSYSNPAVIFLGQIIERLTGDDYEVYVDKNVLKPLEMHRSFFNRAPYHLVRHRSHSYFLDASGLREGRFDFDTRGLQHRGHAGRRAHPQARRGDPRRAAAERVSGSRRPPLNPQAAPPAVTAPLETKRKAAR